MARSGSAALFISPLIGILLSSLLAACTFVDIRDEVSYGDHRNPITQTRLEKIQPNQTTVDWLLENLGAPSVITDTEDGAEVYTYHYEEQHRQRTRILFLFSYRVIETVPRQVSIRIRGGKVDKVWTDTGRSRHAPTATVPPKPLPKAVPEPSPESAAKPMDGES